MESTKTQKMVLAAMLAALGMILNLIEIPYPFAPWLNLDLSEIVVLVAISTLGFVPALFVCICKFFVSILFKGPVGPMAIGQIAALIASLSICVTYSLLARKIDPEKNLKNYLLDMVLTMLVFAFIMFVINYFFVTPTYLCKNRHGIQIYLLQLIFKHLINNMVQIFQFRNFYLFYHLMDKLFLLFIFLLILLKELLQELFIIL